MKFKLLTVVMAFAMLFTAPAYAKTLEFTINSQKMGISDNGITEKTLDTSPVITDGRTLVPVRVIAEEYGADVIWNGDTREVSIKNDGIGIVLAIDNQTAHVNGEEKTLDVPPVIIEDRTMIPLRFVSETFGMNVDYIASTRQILITNEQPVMSVNGKNVYIDDFKFYKLISNYDLTDENLKKNFCIMATNNIVEINALCSLAESNGIANLSDEETQNTVWYLQQIKNNTDFLVAFAAKNIQNINNANAYIESLSNNFEQNLSDEDIEDIYNTCYVKAKHILVSDETLAKEILDKINKGEDFDLLMNKYTEDPGIEAYPDGYLFTTGDMVQEFENAAFDLKDGQVSDIVQTQFGYHIIKREPLPPFDDATRENVNSSINSILTSQWIYMNVNSAKVDMYMTEDEIISLLN